MAYPYPPLTPEDPRLIAEALAQQLAQAWDRLEAEYQQVLNSVDLGRNQLVLEQLAEFQSAVTAFQAVVLQQAETFATVELPILYQAGAQAADPRTTFVWTQSDIDAVTSLAADSYDDFLRRSQEFGRTSDSFARAVRQAARTELGQSGTGRFTTKQAAEAMRTRLETEHGIHAVVYADGSIRTIKDYTQMAALTKGAVAVNTGTLNRVAASGTQFVEVFDGVGCGWISHDDPDKANGTVRGVQDAFENPIAHPRCVRAFGGRPDVTTRAAAKTAVTSLSAETQVDLAAESAARNAQNLPQIVVRPAQAARERKAAQRATRAAGTPVPAR